MKTSFSVHIDTWEIANLTFNIRDSTTSLTMLSVSLTCRANWKLYIFSSPIGIITSSFYSRSYIESAGHTCELRDAAEFQSPAEVVKLVSQNPPFDGALAIHLFRAGRLLLGKLSCCFMNCYCCQVELRVSCHLSYRYHYLSVSCLNFTTDIQVPFGIIFGGTDINEDVKLEQKRAVMKQVLQKARWCFCELLF